jgi:DNA-directed RNA polymerase specialized sigma24 family protein
MNPSDVTTLLDGWRRGDRDALERLLPLVYSELRRIAARQLKNERAGHTLQPTALVHEAYLRLADQRQVDWQNQAHFFGVAAQVMRRVLVDHALDRLEKIDPGLAKLVELRAFSGLNNEQAALVLDISPSTVKRELRTAKAWLTNELGYGGCRE